MPVSWTSATNERLLVAILAVHDIRPNCDALAKSIGPECSAKAVSLQIGKLKKMAAEADAGGTDGEAAKGDGAASVPATPKKRGGAKGAKAADGEGEGAGGGDVTAAGTPAGSAAGKAKRKVTATAKAKAAAEDDGDSAAKGAKKRAAAGGAKGKKAKAEAVKHEVVEEEAEDSGATVGEDEKKVKKVKTEYGAENGIEVERSMELDGSVEV